MVVIGVPFGPQNTVFEWLYTNIQVPMDATMFSLLAFFIASAAFRAFRARTFEASLLLITALIVMMGNVPVGDLIWNTVLGVASFGRRCFKSTSVDSGQPESLRKTRYHSRREFRGDFAIYPHHFGH